MSVISILREALTPTVLAVLAAVVICALLFASSAGTSSLHRLPGPPRYPVIGSVLSNPPARDFLPTARRFCEEYTGGMVYVTAFVWHTVLLYTAEAVEPLFASRKLLDKGVAYNNLRPWLGEGLIVSAGSKWHVRRKLITPAFHFAILDQFLEVMKEQSAALVARLDAAGPGPLNVWPLVSDATLNIICETAMGVSVDAQSDHLSRYKAAVTEMGGIMNERNLKPWLRNRVLFWISGWRRRQDEALEVLHTFTKSVIEKRRKMLEQGVLTRDVNSEAGSKRRHAFLDTLLLSEGDGGIKLTDSEVAEETDTFMFAGHDTTTSGICWALYNIARLPDVQRKIHQELDQMLDKSPQDLSREDLGKLDYLERAIKESIRIHPPVVFISRTLCEDAVILGHTIPKGTDVAVFPHMIHRDPRHWSDPERFDPDRFLPENSAGRHPYSYVPFAAGARNCIGQRFALLEMKTVLASVLRRFRVSTSQQYSEKMLKVSLTLQTHGPLQVTFETR